MAGQWEMGMFSHLSIYLLKCNTRYIDTDGLVHSAGVFSAHAALELYTEIFEKSGASIEQVHSVMSVMWFLLYIM